jgi:acyl carrier protein
MDTQSKLKEFIEQNLALGRDSPTIKPDEALFRGLLDSTDMLRLVLFLETEFGIKVEDDELVPENFQSVITVAKFVEKKAK